MLKFASAANVNLKDKNLIREMFPCNKRANKCQIHLYLKQLNSSYFVQKQIVKRNKLWV